ncbi:MAG: hypothetical protein ABJA78_13340 [Ferruginibacter sp.]
MKLKFLLFLSLIILNSCNKNIYGIYESSKKDKSASLLINLKQNHLVEKTEIHVIRIDQKGTWKISGGKIICFLEENQNGFPKDTLSLKIRGKKMFIFRNGILAKNYYLRKL